MRTAAPRRAALALAALAAISACSRDLDLPALESSPPSIDAVAVVGLEPQAVVSSLPVLGGELVAIHGGGFPDDVAEVEVRIGSEDAEVLDVRADRIVARVPALSTFGRVDLQVRTAIGFRTQAGAFRYDGGGQPSGFGSSDLDTAVDLGFVTPARPPGDWGFSDLAVATGASDSALLVVPTVGFAMTTIPLGIVPSSAASWIDMDGPTLRMNVLATARGGAAAYGSVLLDGNSLQAHAPGRPLALDPLVDPGPCSRPQVIATHGSGFPFNGQLVATWSEGPEEDRHLVAAVDRIAARDEGRLRPSFDAAGVHTVVGGAITGWGPWGASSVVFSTGSGLYQLDAASAAPPEPLRLRKGGGPATPVTALLTAGGAAACGASVDYIYTVATATTQTAEPGRVLRDVLAVAYRAGGTDRVALVDLGPGAEVGTVWSGVAGTIPTALTIVPDPAYATSASLGWQVLAAGGSSVYRLRRIAGGPACRDLVPDAALSLSETPGYLAGFGGMATVADGTRVLSITTDGDLVTVLPPSLTSAGPVARFASYGGVSIQQAEIGGASFPVAVAEHASADTSVSSFDTGSALLLVSLADRGGVALGGSGFGRGAVWLEGGALAYTGDLRATGSAGFKSGGAASVTGFSAGQCAGETVRITASRPVLNGPHLVAQGPARSGALGPEGIARHGPLAAPIYTVRDEALHAYGGAKLACLAGAGAGAGDVDWDPAQTGSCAPDASVALGLAPLDVTLSAGDRAAAMRYIGACAPLLVCPPGDRVCERAQCPPASELVIARAVQPDPAAATTLVVKLPGPPAWVAADRGGGFLVTMPCDEWSASSGECFRTGALCDDLGAEQGEESGALVLVQEDGSAVECLAVQPALAGPLAVTPNGAEVWVTGANRSGQHLVRLGLARRTSDGGIDPSRPAARISSETLYLPPPGSAATPGGVAFTADGTTAIVTVPGQYRVLLRE